VELTGNVGLTSSSPEKSQPDEKQWHDFSDRLRRLQIEFQRNSFFLGLGLWLLITGTWFNLKGGLPTRGGDDDRQRRRARRQR
jgi:hypothetical protein